MLHPPQADDAAAAGGERHGQLRLAGAGGGYGQGQALVGGGEGWPRRPETARAADDVQSDGCCSCGVQRDGHGCA